MSGGLNLALTLPQREGKGLAEGCEQTQESAGGCFRRLVEQDELGGVAAAIRDVGEDQLSSRNGRFADRRRGGHQKVAALVATIRAL